jgi:hypothetical protein
MAGQSATGSKFSNFKYDYGFAIDRHAKQSASQHSPDLTATAACTQLDIFVTRQPNKRAGNQSSLNCHLAYKPSSSKHHRLHVFLESPELACLNAHSSTHTTLHTTSKTTISSFK